LYGPNGLPFEYLPNGSGATPEWLFCDATTGSVGSVTDTTGTIIATHAYDPWGNTTATTGTPVSLGWHAQYQDPETHFYNLWHRYYDPATAQFTTPDPLYALTGERYGYADNDPINGEDLTGLWWGEGTLHNIAHTVNNDVIKPVERTNVKTDLAVVGMAAGVAALTVATGGLGDAVLGVSAATVGFAASATSVGIGAGIAAIDCSHRADAKCVFEAASAAAGFAGGELSLGGDMVSELGADWGDLGDYMSGVGDYALGGVWGLGYGIPTLFMRDAMDQRAAKCGA
ncbi:MAG: RHS repeat-associated core domain-containing protein, partial [Actinobacteria bacterium]|nr:RHS repeat-associated core domain-containing protein [Actinomycetota bacterium]